MSCAGWLFRRPLRYLLRRRVNPREKAAPVRWFLKSFSSCDNIVCFAMAAFVICEAERLGLVNAGDVYCAFPIKCLAIIIMRDRTFLGFTCKLLICVIREI